MKQDRHCCETHKDHYTVRNVRSEITAQSAMTCSSHAARRVVTVHVVVIWSTDLLFCGADTSKQHDNHDKREQSGENNLCSGAQGPEAVSQDSTNMGAIESRCIEIQNQRSGVKVKNSSAFVQKSRLHDVKTTKNRAHEEQNRKSRSFDGWESSSKERKDASIAAFCNLHGKCKSTSNSAQSSPIASHAHKREHPRNNAGFKSASHDESIWASLLKQPLPSETSEDEKDSPKAHERPGPSWEAYVRFDKGAS